MPFRIMRCNPKAPAVGSNASRIQPQVIRAVAGEAESSAPTASKPLAVYFSDEFTELKTPFSVVPRPFTAAMIANEMPAAIKPYSIAVAADSSFQKQTNKRLISTSKETPSGQIKVGR
jgi:hypothetical protein